MKRYIIILAALLLSAAVSAQEYPQMKELKESALSGRLHPQMRKDKWGFANDKDFFVIKPVFDQVEEFRVVKETMIDTVLMARVWVGGKVGMIKRNGTYLLTPEYDEISDFTSQDIAYFTQDGKHGFADLRSGVCASGMDEIQPFDGKSIAWFRDGESWGAVTLMGSRIIRPGYDSCPVAFHGNLFLASKGGKVGLVDSKSYAEVIPIAYESLVNLGTDELVLAKTEGRMGCLKMDGSTVLEPEFDALEFDPASRLFFAAKDGKTGAYNVSGKQIVSHIMNGSPDFSRGPVRIFDAGTPMLLFSQGDYVSAKESRYETSFPHYLRPGYYASLNDPWDRWNADCPVLGIPEVADPNIKKILDWNDDPFIAELCADHNRSIRSSSGPVFCNSNNMGDLVLTPKGLGPIKIGALITKLFTENKPAALENYDKVYETNFAHEWEDMGFKIFLCEPIDGKYLVGINEYLTIGMTVRALKNTFAIIDTAGKIYNTWSYDGSLLNPSNYVGAETVFAFLLEDGSLLFSGQYCSYVNTYYEDTYLGFTEVRDRSGKLICHVDDGVSFMVVKNDANVVAIEGVGDVNCLSLNALMFNPSDWACKKIEIPNYLFGEDNMVPTLLTPELLRQGFDESVACSLIPLDEQAAPVPVLMYWPDDWGGTEVHSFGVTYSSDQGDAPRWVTIFGKLEPGTIDIRPDLAITIEDVNEDGLARYFYEREGRRHYGYAGDGCFTQAIYSESTPFVDGKAEVRLGGTLKTLTREEILVPADFAPATEDAKPSTIETLPDSGEKEAIPLQLVEEKPSFNGGDANEFTKWVNSQLHYPDSAAENGIEGRVMLQFTVFSDGHVGNVKVLRGVDPELDKEAVRVVSMSPEWKPGYQKGKPVSVTYTFPVIFQKQH